MNLGYGNEEMAKAISDQCVKLAYYTPFGDMTSPPSLSELAHELGQLTPGDLNTFQFTNSGSTAVESANSVCALLLSIVSGNLRKKHIIYRENAYHGSTYLAASLEWQKM